MFKRYFLLAIVACFFCCGLGCKQEAEIKEAEINDVAGRQSHIIGSVTARILPSAAGGYGYEIYINNMISIRQPFMPAVTGYRGFPDSTKAAKVAALVMAKIDANKLPPSVSRKELDSLEIYQDQAGNSP